MRIENMDGRQLYADICICSCLSSQVIRQLALQQMIDRKQLWKVMKINNRAHKMFINKLYEITKTNKDACFGLLSEHQRLFQILRSNHAEVYLEKGSLIICSKFTGEHRFIEITLQHRCSPVNLLHIFRTSFLKNTSRRLLLDTLLLNKISE